MTTSTTTRVYLDNMGTDGFGEIYESRVAEYDVTVAYQDGTTRTRTAWTWPSETNRALSEEAMWLEMQKHEIIGGPSPVSAEVTDRRTALLWWQRIMPGKVDHANYIELDRRGRKISDDGPGNLHDRGETFDVAKFAELRGVEIAD